MTRVTACVFVALILGLEQQAYHATTTLTDIREELSVQTTDLAAIRDTADRAEARAEIADAKVEDQDKSIREKLPMLPDALSEKRKK